MRTLGIIGTLAAHSRPWRGWRRGAIALLVALCALLSVFPERHRVVMALSTGDSPCAPGMRSDLPGATDDDSLCRAAIDRALWVAGSRGVREGALQRLSAADRASIDRADVEIRAVRGGIIQISLVVTDDASARRITGAFAGAATDRLAMLSRSDLPGTIGFAARTRPLSPPYVEPGRVCAVAPLCIGLLVLMAGLAIEFHDMRPPVGSRGGRA